MKVYKIKTLNITIDSPGEEEPWYKIEMNGAIKSKVTEDEHSVHLVTRGKQFKEILAKAFGQLSEIVDFYDLAYSLKVSASGEKLKEYFPGRGLSYFIGSFLEDDAYCGNQDKADGFLQDLIENGEPEDQHEFYVAMLDFLEKEENKDIDFFSWLRG